MKKIQLLTVAMSVLLAFVASRSINAQVVPFKSVGSSNAYDPVSLVFGGSGNTSHMGKTTGSGIAVSVPLTGFTVPTWVFAWEGSGEFVAPNGDKLYFKTDPIPDPPTNSVNKVFVDTTNYPILTAKWVGKFHITGGTGRFANAGPASAPLDVVAINAPFYLTDPKWLYDYSITGEINLGKK